MQPRINIPQFHSPTQKKLLKRIHKEEGRSTLTLPFQRWLRNVYINVSRIASYRDYHVLDQPFEELTQNLRHPSEYRFAMNRVYLRWELRGSFEEIFKDVYGEDYASNYRYFDSLDLSLLQDTYPDLYQMLSGIKPLLSVCQTLIGKIIFRREDLNEELDGVLVQIAECGITLNSALFVYHGYLTDGNQIGVNFVRDFSSRLREMESLVSNVEGLLVINGPLSSSGKKSLQGIEDSLVVITEEDLQVFIMDHKFVIPHCKLTPTQKVSTLRDLGATVDQLPYINASDPVAKIMGLKSGDVTIIRRDFSHLDIMCPLQIAYRTTRPSSEK